MGIIQKPHNRVAFVILDCMNMRVIPAILEQRKDAIVGKMRRVSGLVGMVQVDICDGEFVPSRTYASTGRVESVAAVIAEGRRHALEVELDMMVDLDQSGVMTRWCQVLTETKPARVVFHLGSTYRWDELFRRIRGHTKKNRLPFECGLAIRIDHTRSEVRKVLENYSEFSYIQIMGIEHVGFSGQKLSPKIYDRIRRFHRAFPDMPIQIDGGVKEAHAEKLLNAGASRLGMNSGLYNERDVEQTIHDLQNIEV